jgi:5'-deoxynucleotidase YfbR-like HD superfamily hydrolase
MTAGPTWLPTFTGGQLDPLNPDESHIRIEDIAHALSNLCRWNGHCRHFYSVAEHSIRVSHSVPSKDALWGLLHDAAEAYLGDFVSPLKHHTTCGEEYQRHEARLMAAIASRFGLIGAMPASVLRADHEQQVEEIHWLIDPTTILDRRQHIVTMPPLQAEVEFLNRYRELTGGLMRYSGRA